MVCTFLAIDANNKSFVVIKLFWAFTFKGGYLIFNSAMGGRAQPHPERYVH